MLKKLADLWRTWRAKKPPPADKGPGRYVVAKCIGCGQCAEGCPLAVKVKKK